MTAVWIIAIWILAACLLALLVGRMIAFGGGRLTPRADRRISPARAYAARRRTTSWR